MAEHSPAMDSTGAQDAAGEAGAGPATTLPPAIAVDEAARLLRVNWKTLYDAVRDGRVPGVVRMGRSIRIFGASGFRRVPSVTYTSRRSAGSPCGDAREAPTRGWSRETQRGQPSRTSLSSCRASGPR